VSLMDRFPSFVVSTGHAVVAGVVGLALVSALIAYGCATAARAR